MGRPKKNFPDDKALWILRGTKLKLLREGGGAKKIQTQEELADNPTWRGSVSAGHHKDTISRWETGASCMDDKYLPQIAEYFSIPKGWMLDTVNLDRFVVNIEALREANDENCASVIINDGSTTMTLKAQKIQILRGFDIETIIGKDLSKMTLLILGLESCVSAAVGAGSTTGGVAVLIERINSVRLALLWRKFSQKIGIPLSWFDDGVSLEEFKHLVEEKILK